MGEDNVRRLPHGAPSADERTVNAEDGAHARLFATYRNIETRIRKDDQTASALIAAQTFVMRNAASLPALTLEDLLYKLALWRWDAPDLDQPSDRMTRYDAVAYGAFRDFAAMMPTTPVLTEFDLGRA
ncbi:MAG: hypothetical protein ACFB00_00430 [Parvularculaceae bacterium]